MAFKIVYDDTGTSDSFGDEASFGFNGAGMLVIRTGDTRRVYSPHAWRYLEGPRNQETPGTESDPVG